MKYATDFVVEMSGVPAVTENVDCCWHLLLSIEVRESSNEAKSAVAFLPPEPSSNL